MKLKSIKDSSLELLGRSFLFEEINCDLIEYTINNDLSEWVFFDKNDVIYDRTNYRKSLGIIITGNAIVSKDIEDGRRVIINTLFPSEIFGGAAVYVDNDEFIGEIKANEKSCVLFINRELLNKLFEKDVRIAENYIKFLSGALLFLNKKIDGFTAIDTQSKFSRFLLENMYMDEGGLIVKCPYSITKLAEFLNMGRASLYRNIKELCDDNIIERDGKRIKILDADKLNLH